MIEVINNLIKEEEVDHIINTISGNKFPWYLQNTYVLGHTPEQDSKTPPFFCHILVKEGVASSTYVQLLNPILRELGNITLIRAKINCSYYCPQPIDTGWHVDLDSSLLPKIERDTGVVLKEGVLRTAVFYLNSNDGVTKVQGEGEFASIRNRFVSFNSDVLHSGTCHTYKKDRAFRLVINLNYLNHDL